MPDRTLVSRAVKPNKRALTTTSYAILGLLSVQPWSAYELAQQMQRSLRFHWPRANSRIYMEAPNLVAHGFATATVEHTGARPRTVYTITRTGRAAFRRWLAQPSAAPQFESEALLRTMFAESGSKDDLLRTLAELRDQAHDAWTQLMRQGVEYLDTGGPFPQRLHLIALNGRFLLAFTKLLEDWAAWARREVDSWTNTDRLTDTQHPIATFRRVLGDDVVRDIRLWALREPPDDS